MQNDPHLAALVVAMLDVRTVAQIAVFAIALALAIAALVITRRESRSLDPRELLAGAAVLVGLVALSTDTVLEPDRETYEGRMRRELARHGIDVREICPPPAPGLSNTLTLIVNDQELAAPPRVETCFRVKLREPAFMPAAIAAERTP